MFRRDLWREEERIGESWKSDPDQGYASPNDQGWIDDLDVLEFWSGRRNRWSGPASSAHQFYVSFLSFIFYAEL